MVKTTITRLLGMVSPVNAHPPSRSSRSRPDTARQGLWGEDKALRYLEREKGLRLRARRVRAGRGEIDLVMEDCSGGIRSFVFVEVKTRSSHLFGGGLGAVDYRKKKALCHAIIAYMRRQPRRPFRIDVVEVYGSAAENRVDEIAHYVDAVRMPRYIHTEWLGIPPEKFPWSR